MSHLIFTQLLAFEAAAKHLSFTSAARVLNVQQPAISRQVAALEETIGSPLFLRTKPRLTLTRKGETLFQALSSGLGEIREALKLITVNKRNPVVIVNAAIGFTSFFIMPRLAGFQSRYPNYQIQLVTRDQNAEFGMEEADIAVSFADEGMPGYQSAPIIEEELVAVCDPGYLRDRRSLSLEKLAQEKLLFMSSADHADDWERYFAGTGISVPEPVPSERMMSFMVYVMAIRNGRGIGLGWRGLVDTQLEEGSLVLAAQRQIKTGRAYFANLAPAASSHKPAIDFWSWLVGSGLAEAVCETRGGFEP